MVRLTIGIQILILLLVVAGFGFKVSAVPFHFWAPDVYQGAPTPISGFLSTASKSAGFIVLIRFMLAIFPQNSPNWLELMMIVSIITMLAGNLIALLQKELKRLLAYSSISHAGYILIGVASGNQLGIKAAMYYLLVYLFTNLAAFGVAHIIETKNGSSQISELSGLIKKSPILAFSFLVAMLSLAGIPPFGGFVSKIFIFAAAMEADKVILVLVGIVNSFIGLYYYLVVIKTAFTTKESKDTIFLSSSWKLALFVCMYWNFGFRCCLFTLDGLVEFCFQKSCFTLLTFIFCVCYNHLVCNLRSRQQLNVKPEYLILRLPVLRDRSVVSLSSS